MALDAVLELAHTLTGVALGSSRRGECRRAVTVPAEASRDEYQRALAKAGHGRITTEIAAEPPFYYAEDYHQQYLAKNPGGYCGIGGTGVSCPSGLPG